MAKNVKALDQTDKLRKAAWELIQRNPEDKKLYEENVEVKDFREFCIKMGMSQEDADRQMMDVIIEPAARNGNFILFGSWLRRRRKIEQPYGFTDMIESYRQQILEDAKEILSELISPQPLKRLLISVNLERSKASIMAEVERLVTQELNLYQKDLSKHWFFHRDGMIVNTKRDNKKPRLKWLSIFDDLLAVWDLWIESGEPARQAFPIIAKRLNLPESTVKARWYRAYELIYKTPYEINPIKRKELRTDKALELCLKCTNPICGNRHGGNEIGCPAYEKIAGKNTPRERTHANFDKMADGQAFDSYHEPEEDDPYKDE